MMEATEFRSVIQAQQPQMVGEVVLVFGQSRVVSAWNEESMLTAGSTLHMQDEIKTGPNGGVTIRLLDGESLDIGPNSTVHLDDQVIHPADQVAMSAEEESQSETVQQALSGIRFLQPTAAGAGPANNDGTEVTFLQRSDQSVVPDSGVETDALDVLLQEVVSEILVPNPIETLENFAPARAESLAPVIEEVSAEV